jgi:hypothetical protein
VPRWCRGAKPPAQAGRGLLDRGTAGVDGAGHREKPVRHARVAADGVSPLVHHVFTGPTVAELAEVISADPDFGRAADSSRHAELDALSDDDLDELLRAALAQRSRRRASAGGTDS